MEFHEGEQFRAALDELLSSETFVRSPALARLLTYLVEQVLAGDALSLKESVIGHVLYGLPASYDPKLDSRVRVSANRLRARLDEHYLANPQLRTRIVLARGAYVPTLETREDAAEESVARVAANGTQGAALSLPEEDATESDETLLWTERLQHSHKYQAVFFSVLAGAVLLSLFFWMHTRRPRAMAVDGNDWSVRPFARLGGSQQFGAFSPDGNSLAFTSMSTHHEAKAIYIQGVGSEEAHRLADGLRPAWSPDGKRLAFLRPEMSGKKQIILYDLAAMTGTVLTELGGSDPWLCSIPRLSWNPKGTVLYSTAATGGNRRCGLVSIDIASQKVQPVIPPATALGDLEPAVSPDGSTLAFQRALETGTSDVFVVSTHGGDARRVTHDGSDLLGFDWTPDGKSLVVASSREGGSRRLWKVPVEGGAAKLLTDGSTLPTFPAVSSDGKTINFTQFHVLSPIWRAQDGKTVEVLDNQSENRGPSISPDGKKLLYASDRSGKWQIWVSAADGSDSRPLLHGFSGDTGWARWSPDGKQIVMECQTTSAVHVCMSNTDGTGMHSLTSGSPSQVQPTWSRDGKFIYFVASVSGLEEIFRLNVASGVSEVLTHHGANRAVESWDGKWLYIAKADSHGGFAVLPLHASEQDRLAAEEDRVLPEIRDASWDACKEGIVYAALKDEFSPRLEVYDVQTRKSRQLVALDGLSGEKDLAISVMPDGQSIIYTDASTHSELNMMVPR